MIEVRAVRRGDGPALIAMAKVLAESQNMLQHFKATAEEFEAALFCQQPIVGGLLALVDGRPAGSAIWHRSFSSFSGRETMYFEDLTVLPEHRRIGIGKLLMKELARTALAKGYGKINWHVMKWNENALRFYAEIGSEIHPDLRVAEWHEAALRKFAQ